MLTLQPRNTRNVKLLCIGAHADDLEIGCAGTMLELLVRWSSVDVTWVVLSAVGPRGQEARESARRLPANDDAPPPAARGRRPSL